MNIPKPTLLQCNWALGSAAILLLLSAYLSRVQDARICTWIAILASVVAVYVVSRGFGSRLNAILRVGFVYLTASWCAYALWHFHMMPQFHPTLGIDPFAGPLSIIATFNFIFGLATWLSALWAKRKGSYWEGFFHQRLFWTLGALMLFTSSYFFGLIKDV